MASPDMTRPPLSQDQVADFIRDGYATAPGMIPPDLVVSCRRQMWEALGVDPSDCGAWPEKTIIVPHEIGSVMAPCRTSAMEAAAAQLVGPNFRRGGGFSPVLNFPRPGPPEFAPLGFHIDGINEVSLWPVCRYLVILAYLTDTTEYGGALAVRPGSHRQALAHWLATGTEPGGSTAPPDLEYAPPVPVPGRAGDVVFLHYLLVHASSQNHDDHVRVAINGTIVPDPIPTNYPKLDASQGDWTPLDWTLRADNRDTQ